MWNQVHSGIVVGGLCLLVASGASGDSTLPQQSSASASGDLAVWGLIILISLPVIVLGVRGFRKLRGNRAMPSSVREASRR